jgi:hypothetical protein
MFVGNVIDVMNRFHGRPDELIDELEEKYHISIGMDGSVTQLKSNISSKLNKSGHHKQHNVCFPLSYYLFILLLYYLNKLSSIFDGDVT